MNRSLPAILAIFIYCTTYGQWTAIPSGTDADLLDVHFIGDQIGYAVGEHGVVLKSWNAGESWEIIHVDSTLGWESVFFTTPDTGYAAAGELYKTADGGITWTSILTDSAQQMHEVYFVDRYLGFAAGSKLYRTADGGASWTAIDLNTIITSIHFPEASTGYFIGGADLSDPLYKTTDGGLTFLPVTNGFQSIKESTHFINSYTGFMCGWYGGALVKTTDGGINWNPVSDVISQQCWAVYFSNENLGYFINNESGDYRILKTIDGGITWTTELLGSGKELHAFQFLLPSIGIAVGDGGTIYRSVSETGLQVETMLPFRNLHLYPNPFHASATIRFATPVAPAVVTLFNAIGEPVLARFLLSGQTITLERGQLPAGAYFVKVTQANHVIGHTTCVIMD